MAAKERWIRIALTVITWAVFWPILTHSFLHFDDDLYVTRNAVVQAGLTFSGLRWAFTTAHAGNYYPLTLLSHMADVALFGLRPWGHHLTNLLLHTLNVLLAFEFFKRATADRWRAAAVAALFAVHPVQVETVAWVAERKNLLCAAFSLCAALAYIRGRRGWTLAAAVAAALSKPAAVSLPLGLLALDVWPLRRVEKMQERFVEKIPLFLVTLLTGLGTLLIASPRRDLPFWARLANASVSLGEYAKALAWPTGLAVFYPHPGTSASWGLALAWAITLGSLCWLARRSPPAMAGVAWACVWLLPVLGFIQVGQQARADRYLYLPILGLAAGVVWMIPERWVKQRIGLTVVGAAFGALMVGASLQVRYWEDSLTLWRRAAEVTEGSDVVLTNLGYEYFLQKRTVEAVRVSREAVKLAPKNGLARNNLGRGLLAEGHFAEAAEQLQIASELLPGDPVVLENLAAAKAGR